MNLMSTVSDALGAVGAGDAAITAMGPIFTIALALIGGIAVGQGVKFPLSLVLKGDAHGYVVRICAVFATFCFAHFLSNHLSVPLEVLVALCQPLVYLGLKAATAKWLPWASILFASVGTKS
jgi:hypothetical protein